jgi:hypothetical protein
MYGGISQGERIQQRKDMRRLVIGSSSLGAENVCCWR